MKARLYDDFHVEICEESVGHGGSFRQSGEDVVAYNSKPLSFFHKELLRRTNPVVLDVGSNTGAFSLLAKFVPGVIMLAFEPNKEVSDICNKNIGLNGLEGSAFCVNAALWDRPTKIPFYAYLEQHGYSRLKYPFVAGGGEEPYSVKTTTIDLVQLAAIDVGAFGFIKLDVEGAERNVLAGGLVTLQKYRPDILMEWHAPNCEAFGYHPREIDDLMVDRLSYTKEEVSDTWVYYKYRHRGEQ